MSLERGFGLHRTARWIEAGVGFGIGIAVDRKPAPIPGSAGSSRFRPRYGGFFVRDREIAHHRRDGGPAYSARIAGPGPEAEPVM